MPLSRREIIRAGLGAGLGMFFAGCNEAAKTTALPAVPWPEVHPRPQASEIGYRAEPDTTADLGRIMSRSQWTKSDVIRRRVNAMGNISRITLHHEGSPNAPVLFSDVQSTARRIELIRKFHLERGWGDIGYHFVIDRSGRVWEARPLAYQGAHVKNQNPHNVGVMCLGNFNIQQPSNAQLQTVARFTRSLRRKYRVQQGSIYTHRELGVTSCPGNALQPKIVTMRSNGVFA